MKDILDLIRPTPRDPNYTEPSDVMRLLRPELIAGYAEYLRLKILTNNEAKRKAEKKDEEKKDENAEEEKPEKIGKKVTWKWICSSDLTNIISEINLKLNPNVFANVELACTEEERVADVSFEIYA